MSDVDPTPLTPVTLGDRLGWWRGELREQLATQHTELLAALAAQHAALISAIQASAASGLATETTSQAILDAIGELSTFPAGWTVRALLAQLNTSIDVDMAGKEGQPPTSATTSANSDPGLCGGYNAITPIRLYLRDTGHTQTDAFDRTYQIYSVIWPNVSFSGGTLRSLSNCVYASSDVEACVSWDFTGVSGMSPEFGICWGETTDIAYIPQLNRSRVEPGNTTFSITTNPANYTYTSFYFGREVGLGLPPPNAWLRLAVAL